MKVDEFLQSDLEENRDPGDETKEPEFEHVTSLTPSGIECLYSWAPKRLYRVRRTLMPDPVEALAKAKGPFTEFEWTDVPSVTTVLGILEKPALPWWGMKVGVEGVLELLREGIIYGQARPPHLRCPSPDGITFKQVESVDELVSLLTQHKLTVNHVKDKAADRGVNVHNALEAWSVDQSYRGNPDLYEEHERGYVIGLNKFLDDMHDAEEVQAEVMVGSLEHGFAGRYDLRLFIQMPREMVVKTYPKRSDKREEIEGGTYLLDLKTSKSVYPSHGLQLAAYELASIEDGYGATDYRAVIHVTQDGKYEFVRTHAKPEDFLSILQAYNTMSGAKSWL